MTVLQLHDQTLTATFDSWWERLFTGRPHVSIALADIAEADVVDHALRICHGPRKGLEVTGFVKVGTWGLAGPVRRLVSLRRHRPTLRIRLTDTATSYGFGELWVSTPSAEAVLTALEEVTAGTLRG